MIVIGPNDVPTEPLSSVLERVFPDQTCDDATEAGPSWNENNRTVAVTFADGGRAPPP